MEKWKEERKKRKGKRENKEKEREREGKRREKEEEIKGSRERYLERFRRGGLGWSLLSSNAP